MTKTTKLNADKREIFGSKVKRLRQQRLIPANIFSPKKESVAITVSYKDFVDSFEKAGETGIIEITVGDVTKNVLISEIQYHPVDDNILHVDFREVDLSKKVSAMVPVELVGEAPAEKTGIGVLVQHVNELEVEALPLELPESFEIDVSELESLEDQITVADIKVDPEKVTIEAEPDQIIANITEISEEEVEEPQEPTADEEAEGEESSAGQDKPESKEGTDEEHKSEAPDA